MTVFIFIGDTVDFYENKKKMYAEINRIIELFKRRDECIDHNKFIDEIRIAFGLGDRVILDYFELLQRKGLIQIQYEKTTIIKNEKGEITWDEPDTKSRLLIVPIAEQIRLNDDRISEKDVS